MSPLDERILARFRYATNAKVPGMLHAAIIRSPHASARIIDIDVTRVPTGVVTLRAEDLGEVAHRRYGAAIKDEPVLAVDRVRYVGEPVVAVAGATPEAAQAAADLVSVNYEVLTPALGACEAAAPGAPLVHDGTEITSDMAAAVNVRLRPTPGSNICHTFRLALGAADWEEEADVVVEREYQVAGAAHVPLEPHATIARWTNGRLVIEGGTQTPFANRTALAELFGLREEDVRITTLPMGGSFGSKTFLRLEPIVAALARKADAPVGIVLSRVEEFLTLNRHPVIFRIRLGAKASGELVGKSIDAWWDTGAYADAGPDVATKGGYASIGPYRIPHVRLESRCVYTNTVPNGAYRGYAAMQAVWASERCMDELADELGVDPLQLRLKNLLREGDTFATGETLHDFHIEECLRACAEHVGWSQDRVGKGLAVVMKGMHTPSLARAGLSVRQDGRLVIQTATTEFGQRVDRVQAQLAADALDAPVDLFVQAVNDTDDVPFDARTTSSRSVHMMAGALGEAAADLRRQVAEKLDGSPEDVDLTQGDVRFNGSSAAWSDFAGLTGTGTFQTQGGLDPDTGQGLASSEWHQGAAAVEVEVDRETGVVHVKEMHTAAWVGHVVDRAGAELQTEGCMILGYGAAFFEEISFDREGQPQQLTMSDYNIPSMADVPTLSYDLLEGGPGSTVHGLGETAVPPLPAAIGNALQSLGVAVRQIPMTPERVRAAVEEPIS
jgi:CO/xanthine dehydrogenase Mo-binding subunit